jgi:ankyrin repeat protein
LALVLELLIHHKQDFRADRSSDHTVLFLAALRGDAAITQVLLRHGADVNARCRNGRTPLTWARRGGDGAVIDLLMWKGADEGSPDPPVPKENPYWGGYPH